MSVSFSAISTDRSTSTLRKCGVLALALAIVGLPINEVGIYALLLVFTIILFSGEVRSDKRSWVGAVVITCVAIVGQIALAPPRIEEGHNVFLPGGPNEVLKSGLPQQ